jgi:tetratricopeptide (TPR) repeat protein
MMKSNNKRDNLDAIFKSAALKLQQGDARGAQKGFEKIVKRHSSNHIIWHHLGMSYQHLNEHAKAVKAYKKSVYLKSDFIDSWVNLGLAYKELGSTELAIKASEKALKIEPDHPRALNLLGSMQARNQEFELAKESFEKALLVDTNNWHAIFNLANVNLELGNYDETHRLLEPLKTRDPENKPLRELQAQCLIYQKQYGLADQLVKGLESDYPGDEKVLRLTLSVKEVIHDHFAVLDIAKELLKRNTKDAGLWNSLGSAYYHLDLVEKAQSSYEKAILLSPGSYAYLHNLGMVYSSLGDKQNAEKFYRDSLTINPCHADAHKNLVSIKRYESLDDPDIKAIENLWNRGGLDEPSTINLSFALGKVYDDCALYDQAFDTYKIGNDLKFKDSNSSIDLEKYYNHIDRISTTFTLPPEKVVTELADTQPIFVLGMPRSGTTLVEQVISRHSSVTGCGELPGIERAIGNLEKSASAARIYPDDFSDISVEQLAVQSREYITGISAVHDLNTRYFTDKMPFNFVHIWLLKAMFPNSSIVNCQRHPLDVILSNYFQLFGSDVSFVYNLEALSLYYVRYHQLMIHWRNLFGRQITDIRYEDLVTDNENQIRILIEAIGLPWEESCLNQKESMKTVRTASIWQVRQGIYTRSKERWRHYQQKLQPVISILCEHGILDSDHNHIIPA